MGGMDPSMGGMDPSMGGMDPSMGGMDPSMGGGMDPNGGETPGGDPSMGGGMDPSMGGMDPSMGGGMDPNGGFETPGGEPTTINNTSSGGDPSGGGENGQSGAVCQVVVYGTTWCSYCTKTKNLLTSNGVSFLDKDIEKDAGAREEMEAKMAKAGVPAGGVPVIDFCGQIIKGFNEALLLELCKSQGKN